MFSLREIPFSTNSRKFSPVKDSHYTVEQGIDHIYPFSTVTNCHIQYPFYCEVKDHVGIKNTRMAGNFRGVLIFVIFVVDSAVTKISTHEN